MARSNNNLKAVLQDTADAIRSKSGRNNPIVPRDFSDTIRAIPTGITPSGRFYITQNGSYNIANYQYVDVEVEPPVPLLEEDKIYIGVRGSDEGTYPELLDPGLYEVDAYGYAIKYTVSTGTIYSDTFYINHCTGQLDVVSAGVYEVDSSGYGYELSFSDEDIYYMESGIRSLQLPSSVNDSVDFFNSLGTFRITKIS